MDLRIAIHLNRESRAFLMMTCSDKTESDIQVVEEKLTALIETGISRRLSFLLDGFCTDVSW